jgi:hypothetical protein
LGGAGGLALKGAPGRRIEPPVGGFITAKRRAGAWTGDESEGFTPDRAARRDADIVILPAQGKEIARRGSAIEPSTEFERPDAGASRNIANFRL